MRQTVLISSPALWRTSFGGNHPLKPERLARTVALMEAYGALAAPNVTVTEPRPATDAELALFHTPQYIEAVKRLSAGETTIPAGFYGFGPGDNPVFAGMYESSRLVVGGGLQAAELLRSNACDVAFNFSGGFHHARPARASGFCIFNDIAVVIRWLVQQGQRVAYVDIDAHHGDGVQAAFYDTDRVLTISLHQDGHTLFPGTGFVDELGVGAGEGYSVNIPLYLHTDDATYLWAFQEIVPPLVRRFAPDTLVTQLGVDTHYRDPLTDLGLTTHGHLALFKELSALAPGKWLATGGGGYDLGVVPRSWTIAFAIMSEQNLPGELPASYRAKYGGKWLHDQDAPMLGDTIRERVQRHAEHVVATLKKALGL